ncbi:MAG: mechanosensitive ion channel family protein [Deltaproteobacteria bacterium]|nr:mechanosensitive ion channel family protein [Deltaproteobacteria bacterium]
MSRLLLIAFLGLGLIPAHAAEPCATPRDAADSLFIYLTPERFDPAQAAACMETGDAENKGLLAKQLKQVLNARRLYVPVDSLPTDGGFLNNDGQAVVVPMPDEAPWLVLRRGNDGQWRYAQSTVAQVPALYADTFTPVSRWLQTRLPDAFYSYPFLGVALWQYLYAGVLLASAWIAGLLTQRILRSQVRRGIASLKVDLDPETWARTTSPLVVLIMGLVLLLGVPDLALSIKLSQNVYEVCWVIVALAGVVWLSRLVDVFARIAATWAAGTESRLDDQLVPLLGQAVRIVVFIVGAFVILDAVGVDVWKLMAGVSLGGLAFALAAQDTVANLFGSVNIFVDKPFQIGDWVLIKDVEGTVEEVGFRSTRVRTFYNSVVTIPNSTITNANVDNMGKRHRRRVKTVLSLTYSTPPDKVQAFVEAVRASLAAHPAVEKSYEVHLYNLGASGLELLVYYHLVTPGWSEELEARAQNLLEFLRIAHELEVSFAFPSQSLYLESTPEHPLPPQASRRLEELQQVVDSFGPAGERARPAGPAFSRSWTVQARNERGSA